MVDPSQGPPPIGFHSEFLPRSFETQDSTYSPQPNDNLIRLSYPPESYPNFPLPNHTIKGRNESQESNSDDSISENFTAKVEFGCSWQYVNCAGPYPDKMVRAGVDADGGVIYAGRAFHEGDMLPAKVLPHNQAAFVAHGGVEHFKEDFEILRQGDFVWEFASNGSIPEGAVQVGTTADGEILYMGRCMYQGTQTPGKVQVSHGCLYIPFQGAEVAVTEYEVLCLK